MWPDLQSSSSLDGARTTAGDLTPASVSSISPETRRRLRHGLRLPLHQLISTAESELESCSGEDQQYRLILQQVLEHAQALLAAMDALNTPSLRTQDLKALHNEAHAQAASMWRLVELLRNPGMPARSLQVASRLGSALEELDRGVINFTPHRLAEQLAQQTDGASDGIPAPANATSPAIQLRGTVLVVDDNDGNRDLLSRRLLRNGLEVLLAGNGRQALRMTRRYAIDLLLLDIMMPEMDGYETLAELKRDPALRHLPVIMITAVDEMESVVRCIQMGADDYLFKPFNATLLRARIQSLLERKRLHDEEEAQALALARAYAEIDRHRKESETLLLNILPLSVAAQLRNQGSVEPLYYEDVTIVFADFVDFALASEDLSADELVEQLNLYFSAFDRIAQRYGVEKLKTIGDCYMYAGGLPVASRSHPVLCVLAAMEMQATALILHNASAPILHLRIGIHTGPVIAGVVGLHKFAFDVWGDTVNLASRLEATGAPDCINLSANTFARVKDFFACEKRGRVQIKDGREVEMYFVRGFNASLLRGVPPDAEAAFRLRFSKYFGEGIPAMPPGLVVS